MTFNEIKISALYRVIRTMRLRFRGIEMQKRLFIL